jgi:effector-binding domain-containing protein
VKKKLLYGAGVLVLLGLIWYFFIKKHDYQVSFTAEHSAGAIYSRLMHWNNWEGKVNKVVSIEDRNPYSQLIQEVKQNDSIFRIEWNFKSLDINKTEVTAYFTDVENSFQQKLRIPFGKTDFVNKSLAISKRIRAELNEERKRYKVSGVSEVITEKKQCACVSIESSTYKKARDMIRGNGVVLSFFKQNDIELNEFPIVEVIYWNRKTNDITFDFCFPFSKENYELMEGVQVKNTKPLKALRVEFNGNYSISDRAWFELLAYAKEKNIQILEQPIEYFYNDPHAGGNDLKWKAKIFMPIEQ